MFSTRIPTLLVAALSMCALRPGSVHATIPNAAKADPLYAKGYLVVTHYPGVHNDESNPATTTAGLNEAIVDAYNYQGQGGSLVVYFPPGVYLVNDTLKAWTATGLSPSEPGYSFATPKNHIAIIGSTAGAHRPVIRLAAGASGFGDATTQKVLLDVRNFTRETFTLPDPQKVESIDTALNQMLRGIDFDCNGNAGAIGVYFAQAQGGSIENVKVIANGAFTGIKGLPARGWGAVNIEVEGGRFGIDTSNTGNAGSTIAAAILRNQTVSAVRHDSFVPLVLVGFNIVTPSGSTQAAVTIEPGFGANSAGLHLIDGTIELGGEPAVSAIDNRRGKNFYARNVFVTGGNKILKSSNLTTISAPGAWKRIDEYSYCDQSSADSDGKQSFTLIDGVQTKTPAPRNNGEVLALQGNSAAPPSDIVSRHTWGSLPSVDDADYFDPVAEGIITLANGEANVSASALQAVIDNPQNKKIFLRKGVYHLDGTITLGKDTVLFGASRFLSRIEVNGTAWKPTTETAMITTVDDPAASTHLGDISIGVDATKLANDWFVALDWKAGRDSIVHIGHVYREPAVTEPINRLETNPHSLLKIRRGGGGRWYFAGSIKVFTSQDPAFRILKVEGTTEPIWFYGLNPEHPGGTDAYVEFIGARNIRIYGVKTEFSGNVALEDKSILIRYSDVTNVAQFGHGAIRNAVAGKGAIEFRGSNTDRVLATLIAPQTDRGTAIGDTLEEIRGAVATGIEYPNVVAIYKRGTITEADESVMVHSTGGAAGGGGGAAGGGGGATGGGGGAAAGGGGATGGGGGSTAGDSLSGGRGSCGCDASADCTLHIALMGSLFWIRQCRSRRHAKPAHRLAMASSG